jgi:hypothetical protein
VIVPASFAKVLRRSGIIPTVGKILLKTWEMSMGRKDKGVSYGVYIPPCEIERIEEFERMTVDEPSNLSKEDFEKLIDVEMDQDDLEFTKRVLEAAYIRSMR